LLSILKDVVVVGLLMLLQTASTPEHKKIKGERRGDFFSGGWKGYMLILCLHTNNDKVMGPMHYASLKKGNLSL
jgi:hypothetical protein